MGTSWDNEPSPYLAGKLSIHYSKCKARGRTVARPPMRPRPEAKQGRKPFMKRWIMLAVALVAWSDAKAEFPTKPITIVVPFGAGSGTGVVTRIIAEPLGSALKQSVVVEDKPGANGAIAAMQVARSAPDGHTLLMGTNSPLSAAPMLNRTLAYDPINDFAPISR